MCFSTFSCVHNCYNNKNNMGCHIIRFSQLLSTMMKYSCETIAIQLTFIYLSLNMYITLKISNKYEGRFMELDNEAIVEFRKTDHHYDANRIKHIYKLVNDPLFSSQWFFFPFPTEDDGISAPNMDILSVWINDLIVGQDVTVIIIGYGLDRNNKDIQVDEDLSSIAHNPNYTINEIIGLPRNTKKPRDLYRSTRSAEIIAMKPGNQIFGVGIAPLVSLGDYRLKNPTTSLDIEYLVNAINHVTLKNADVSLIEWDLIQNLTTENQFSEELEEAFKNSVQRGRDGLGVIHVVGTMTSHTNEMTRSCDKNVLLNSIYTVGVASSDAQGSINSYMENCSAIMVTAYGPNARGHYSKFVAPMWESLGKDSKDYTTIEDNYGGSIVAGILALLVRKKPELNWRQVQYLLVETSDKSPFYTNWYNRSLWTKNGSGRVVSEYFGFGMINAKKLVDAAAAEDLKRIGAMKTYVVDFADVLQEIERARITDPDRVSINLKARYNVMIKNADFKINFIEHVQLEVSMETPNRDNIDIYLISPHGTKAHMHASRRDIYNEMKKPDMIKWKFDTVFMWGEMSEGKWTVTISSYGRDFNIDGKVTYLKVYIHGTAKSFFTFANF